MEFSGAVGSLIAFAIGGGWGVDADNDGLVMTSIIRGTDIPRVASGNYKTVPVRFETERKISSRLLEVGDIVLETAGGSASNGQYTGRTLLITQEVLDNLGTVIPASFCKRLSLRRELVVPNYFFYYMQDLYKSGRVADYDSQSTGISNFQFESFLRDEYVVLPSLAHQETVAKVLSQLDEKIRINTEISKTLEEIAQTIFKSWFVDFDPVHAKARGEKPEGIDDATAALFPDSFEESELGLIPKGWGVRKLETVVTQIRESIKAGDRTLSQTYVPIDQITSRRIFLDSVADSANAKTSLIAFKSGDVLFGAMRPYFHKVALSPFDGTTRTTTFVLRPVEDIHRHFSLFHLFSDEFIEYATNTSQGSTIPYAVWDGPLSNSNVIVPDSEVLYSFEKTASKLTSLGNTLIKQSRILEGIRDALLPRLISGELEIPEEMLTA